MNKEDFIPLKEAQILFEKFKDEYKNTNKNISMLDCLIKNHEIRRLPLYVLKGNNYIETRDNIKTISKEIYVNSNHLRDFFHKELILFSVSDFYGYSCLDEIENEEEIKEKEITKMLRPGLDAVIAKMNRSPEEWTDLYKEWVDSNSILNIEMKLQNESNN